MDNWQGPKYGSDHILFKEVFVIRELSPNFTSNTNQV